MILRNKDDGCIYSVTSEYSDDGFEIYATLREAGNNRSRAEKAQNFVMSYESIRDFAKHWEDID